MFQLLVPILASQDPASASFRPEASGVDDPRHEAKINFGRAALRL